MVAEPPGPTYQVKRPPTPPIEQRPEIGYPVEDRKMHRLLAQALEGSTPDRGLMIEGLLEALATQARRIHRAS